MAFKEWSNDIVKTALNLRFSCGTSGCENLLALGMPFSSVRTLQHNHFQSGLLHEVFKLLKIKVQNFSPQQKYCTMLLDEMAIKEAVEFNSSSKSYFGSETFPGQNGKINHAVVFMLGVVTTHWKQYSILLYKW